MKFKSNFGCAIVCFSRLVVGASSKVLYLLTNHAVEATATQRDVSDKSRYTTRAPTRAIILSEHDSQLCLAV